MKNFIKKKKMDNLGRVVIPKDMREHYNLYPNELVQVIPTENGILLISTKTEGGKYEQY